MQGGVRLIPPPRFCFMPSPPEQGGKQQFSPHPPLIGALTLSPGRGCACASPAVLMHRPVLLWRLCLSSVWSTSSYRCRSCRVRCARGGGGVVWQWGKRVGGVAAACGSFSFSGVWIRLYPASPHPCRGCALHCTAVAHIVTSGSPPPSTFSTGTACGWVSRRARSWAFGMAW